MQAIEVKNLYKSFSDGTQKTEVLKGISLTCHAGELLMIVGPSGCGKTTLLSCMAGTLDIDSGEIWALGEKISALKAESLLSFRAKNLGFIFQQFNLIPTLSLEENVSIPLLLNGFSEQESSEKACAILKEVGLGEKTKQKPSQLSGGQQQRVAIARALAHEPNIIICDEPTSALDGKTGHVIVELLQQLAKNKKRTVILVTHDNRIFSFADRMIEMEDGRIVNEK